MDKERQETIEGVIRVLTEQLEENKVRHWMANDITRERTAADISVIQNYQRMQEGLTRKYNELVSLMEFDYVQINGGCQDKFFNKFIVYLKGEGGFYLLSPQIFLAEDPGIDNDQYKCWVQGVVPDIDENENKRLYEMGFNIIVAEGSDLISMDHVVQEIVNTHIKEVLRKNMEDASDCEIKGRKCSLYHYCNVARNYVDSNDAGNGLVELAKKILGNNNKD